MFNFCRSTCRIISLLALNNLLFIRPSKLEGYSFSLFGSCSPVVTCSTSTLFNSISTSSSMSDAMECPKCSKIFWSRRSFASHVSKCRGSLHGRSSLLNRPSPTHHGVAAAGNNASNSSTVHVAAADYTNTVLSNTRSSSSSDRMASADTLVDSSHLSLGTLGTPYQSNADICTMDVDVSCIQYSDDDMRIDAGASPIDDSRVLGHGDHANGDHATTGSDDDGYLCCNLGGVLDTNDIEPDISLRCKYNSYLSSGLGQMKATIAYQRDVEFLRILSTAKAPEKKRIRKKMESMLCRVTDGEYSRTSSRPGLFADTSGSFCFGFQKCDR